MKAVTKKPNVPALRFPEFSGEWEETQLGNVFSFYPTNSLSRSKLSEFGEGPFVVHYGDIHTKLGAKINDYRVLPKAIEHVKGEPCAAGDLLVADASEDYADIGKATEVTNRESATIVGGLHVIHMRPEQGVFAVGFLSALFQSARIRKQIRRRANGATVLGLSASQIRKIKGRWPELAEQEKVAAFLTVVDERFGLLKRKKELLEEYKKGVMQRLFSREIRFKDEEGNEYPEWEEKRLGEVLTYEQPTKYLVTAPDYSDANRIPVLTAGKTFILGYTSDKKGIYKDVPVIIFDDFTTASQYVNFEFKVKSSAMKILSMKGSQGSLFFVFLALSLVRHSEGDEHKRFWISEFSKKKIPLPSGEEQFKVADFIGQIAERIDLVNIQMKKMNEFKAGLLQTMFI